MSEPPSPNYTKAFRTDSPIPLRPTFLKRNHDQSFRKEGSSSFLFPVSTKWRWMDMYCGEQKVQPNQAAGIHWSATALAWEYLSLGSVRGARYPPVSLQFVCFKLITGTYLFIIEKLLNNYYFDRFFNEVNLLRRK